MPTGTWFNKPTNTLIITTPCQPTTIGKFVLTDYHHLDTLYSRYPDDFIHLSTLLLNYEELQSQFPEYLL